MTAGNGLTVAYSSYDKPTSITRGTTSIGFSHDPEHQRFQQTAPGGTTLYLGNAEKFTGTSGAVRWTNYLMAAGGLVGMHVENSDETVSTRYFHKDHLGSISVITDESGAVLERLCVACPRVGEAEPGEPAAGQVRHRRSDDGEPVQHPRLERLQLRRQQPAELHRPQRLLLPGLLLETDLQGDRQFPAPELGKSRADRSRGHLFGRGRPWPRLSVRGHSLCHRHRHHQRRLGQGTESRAHQCRNGDSIYGIGELTGSLGLEGVLDPIRGGHGLLDFMPEAHVFNMAGHAAVGCASAVAKGDKCGPGALSAAAGSFATPLAEGAGFFGGLVITSTAGGLASVAGGGKFGTGAVTAAFGYLFNNNGRVSGQMAPFEGAGMHGTNAGQHYHAQFEDYIRSKYPQTNPAHWDFNTQPGQPGVDARYRGNVHGVPEYHELKPITQSGERSFTREAKSWGHSGYVFHTTTIRKSGKSTLVLPIGRECPIQATCAAPGHRLEPGRSSNSRDVAVNDPPSLHDPEAVLRYYAANPQMLVFDPDDDDNRSAPAWETKATAHICLGDLPAALKSLERAEAIRKIADPPDSVHMDRLWAVVQFLMKNTTEAIKFHKSIVIGIMDGDIKWTGFWGGASDALDLIYYSRNVDDFALARSFLSQLQKLKRKNRPGPVALHVIGELSQQDMLKQLFSTSDWEEAKAIASATVMNRSFLESAAFYSALGCRIIGDEEGQRELMRFCANLEPTYQSVSFLSRYEVGCSFRWVRN